jgi:hypothetical protein
LFGLNKWSYSGKATGGGDNLQLNILLVALYHSLFVFISSDVFMRSTSRCFVVSSVHHPLLGARFSFLPSPCYIFCLLSIPSVIRREQTRGFSKGRTYLAGFRVLWSCVGGCADKSNNWKRSCVSPFASPTRNVNLSWCRVMSAPWRGRQQPLLGRDLGLDHDSSRFFQPVYPAACTIGATSLSRTLAPPYTLPCLCYAALRYRYVDSTRSTRVRLCHDLTPLPIPRLTPHSLDLAICHGSSQHRGSADSLRRRCCGAVAGWLVGTVWLGQSPLMWCPSGLRHD